MLTKPDCGKYQAMFSMKMKLLLQLNVFRNFWSGYWTKSTCIAH